MIVDERTNERENTEEEGGESESVSARRPTTNRGGQVRVIVYVYCIALCGRACAAAR